MAQSQPILWGYVPIYATYIQVTCKANTPDKERRHKVNKTMAESNETLDAIKTVATIASPFLASYLTYIFAIKGKQRETDFVKRNELNNVLANLLVVWNYLTRLDDLSKLKFDNSIILPIPKDYFSFILLKSGTLNDNCFQELEESVISLKKYDPVSFYELEGLGRRLEFLKTSFILPFINSKSNSELNKTISDKYLKLTIDDIEDFIESISGLIDNETQNKAVDKLQRQFEKDSEKLKNEILQEYYELSLQMNPKSSFTYEDFLNEIEKPEFQTMMNQQFEMINHIDIEKLMEIVAENPNLPFDQIAIEVLMQEIKNKEQ